MAHPLENALDVIVSTFHKYSGREGDKFKLNKSELKELLTQELPSFLDKEVDDANMQEFINELDTNQDSELDFQEYCVILCNVAMICNELFDEFPDKRPWQK